MPEKHENKSTKPDPKQKQPDNQPPQGEGPDGEQKKPAPRFPRGIFPLVAIVLFAFLAIQLLTDDAPEMTVNEFDELLEKNLIEEITHSIDNQNADLVYRKDNVLTKGSIVASEEFFREPNRKKLIDQQMANKTLIYTNTQTSQWVTMLFSFLVPILIFGFIIYFLFIRPGRMMGGAGGMMNFGRSRAKRMDRSHTRVTFEDVAGVEEAKEEVREIIEFLRSPERFRKIGGRIPRGVLLVGPPGTGKTLLAKAIAGEANVPFFSISGSDFVEMFVGVGASRVRDLFREAKENSPCIIFLDEVDAVGRKRGFDPSGSERESNQTLNAILVEMDGFSTDDKVILIAATNRPDVLDPAILRPGRFDREVVLDLPDLKGREAILKVHARKITTAEGLDLGVVARMTPMLSGAELEALINEAAIMAVMRDKDAVDAKDLEDARDKIMFGRERRSRVMDEADRSITAFHEAGHAVLAKLLKSLDPLHKVGIIPRGSSLGATLSIPKKDIYHMSRLKLMARITMALGGRAAEEIFCKDITSGAQSDIEESTRLARYMVTRWGMSDDLGPIDFSKGNENPFISQNDVYNKISEDTAQRVDKAINSIIGECMERARRVIGENQDKTRRIAEGLLRYETLDAIDVDWLLEGKDIAERKPVIGKTVDEIADDSAIRPDEM